MMMVISTPKHWACGHGARLPGKDAVGARHGAQPCDDVVSRRIGAVVTDHVTPRTMVALDEGRHVVRHHPARRIAFAASASAQGLSQANGCKSVHCILL
jgi:hypothetical protein